ncbi:hypothetical protein [Streptomyces sp. 5-10]|uniref:hypothetical protein n=1 Tax=Streptomyces sp. 5-10 TaxID=878925 RepID=UPI001CC2A5E8|nr:hypothetical protein [Streptomyces sp. 5-10]
MTTDCINNEDFTQRLIGALRWKGRMEQDRAAQHEVRIQPMDLNTVEERLTWIRAEEDSARQHEMEDDLYEDVLKAIAEGASNAAELATASLKTKDMDFKRWYD